MIKVQQRYYAKPGMVDSVLAVRREASRVLERLGLPAGNFYKSCAPAEGLPDVVWECTYNNMDERLHFEKVVEASEEFIAVRKKMQPFITRFERDYLELQS